MVTLKKQSQHLASRIEDICKISSEIEKHSYSNMIMGMLRAEHVLIADEIINKYEKKEKGYEKVTLHTDDLERGVQCGSAIFANSFGPWRPKEYFKLLGNRDEPRIVWLLKESFIQNTWYTEQDRGGHDQAKENPEWTSLENTTHQMVVKLTKVIIENACGKTLEYDEVMNHICILELNYFPGLAFHSNYSDDGMIKQWADINIPLIKTLLLFYCPTIVIGGFTLQHFFDCKSCNKEDVIAAINQQNLLMKLDYKPELPHDYNVLIGGKSSNYIIPTINCGPIFIHAYHPTKYKFIDALNDAILIKDLWNSNI